MFLITGRALSISHIPFGRGANRYRRWTKFATTIPGEGEIRTRNRVPILGPYCGFGGRYDIRTMLRRLQGSEIWLAG